MRSAPLWTKGGGAGSAVCASCCTSEDGGESAKAFVKETDG